MKKQLSILITGATSGIGRHTALELAKEGHHVIAAGRRTAALETFLEEAKKAGATAVDILRLDVTNAQSIAEAVRDVEKMTKGRGLDALVNNAGYGQSGPLETVGDAELRAQFDTNIFGLMALTRAFIPQMREKGFGRIVNVGSVGGRITFPMLGAYHATKYALVALTDALRVELAGFGIGVSLIEPGTIRTEFSDVAMGSLASVKNHDAASPYADALAKAQLVEKAFARNAVGPESVTRAIRHAVVARRPRIRYVAPFHTNFLLFAFHAVPTRIMDALFKSVLGLGPRRSLPERAVAAS